MDKKCILLVTIITNQRDTYMEANKQKEIKPKM